MRLQPQHALARAAPQRPRDENDNDNGNRNDDAMPVMHRVEQPLATFRAKPADPDPQRDGNQRGESIEREEAPERHAVRHAGGKEYGGAQAGQEAREEQHAVAVAVEFRLHARVAARREHARDPAQLARALAEVMADEEHDRIADEHASKSDPHHNAQVGVAEPGNDAASDERDVLGNRHAESARDQDREQGDVAVLDEQADEGIEQGHRVLMKIDAKSRRARFYGVRRHVARSRAV